ncbi:aminomethyl-transferring glycine dehydrogenase [Paracidovorax valerianellae]|uniref:Glycine dehydrogenase (decarboxylating) n=1 Tax=Paracidovorax valerianellae TaxID=187868 RepID=A0A1G6UX06_9BURK|nr:aminomethyl-transferring glycine dehydrogenase [Paracidovorax valerianellae]MDA8446904.1 aminomethyl-transferring glycine dehydrogenase [Paracidovorax valerianellae]SDD45236.1 glycine dehydrogenase [Paracidovorax valerianellae]
MLMQSALPLGALENATEFLPRHIGIDEADEQHMLSAIGEASRRALVDSIVPRSIARSRAMDLPPATTEAAALAELKAIAAQNKVLRSFIGQGYHGTHTPGVILRNILENPAWYTAYTPYQAEISQGRMEALVNFQTMVCDLTAMPIANASMLDEATAAAEAMTLAKRSVKSKSARFVVAGDAHPQTIEVIQTRAAPLGIEVVLANSLEEWNTALDGEYFAVLAQYPATSGRIDDLAADAAKAHAKGAAFIAAADLLALTLITPPGEWGADIVVGTTQRFGMPMGAGGPHAAFMACRDEYKRSLPGRLVGVSVDVHGKPAYRLALQTREQHIRREKATSNICTAQVLPAVVASMYAVYHGPQGLTRIAQRVAAYTAILAKGLEQLGAPLRQHGSFDTLSLHTGSATKTIAARAVSMGANLRIYFEEYLCITLDETTTRADVELLWKIFAKDGQALPGFAAFEKGVEPLIPTALRRTSAFLTHPVFNTHHSETGMLRYIRQLSDKDLALDRTMIPLGSCTMKLNATSEMIPITWPEFADVHPFAPAEQQQGYRLLDEQLRAWLCEATGYAGISLQPNAGSQGEYAGLLAIKAYHAAQGAGHRNICLIPSSAHGTNPASAQMVGMQVVVTACDANGNVDLDDLRAKCEQHSAHLACVMITYPSTHGVFETQVKELCTLVHQHGGRVYVDGANMNALVGVAAPGEFGGDVSHLNLHKTFCIPHGGGGPGVGPVCVVADLVPFLPGHRTAAGQGALGAGPDAGANGVGAVSSAPLGNAAVLPISWMYIRMMGAEGLQAATETAILSANYISARLKDHYPTLYASANGHVAHECILDLRGLKETSGVMAEDVAKRLIDYGFHAPTLSFPVPNTLMVEPTESETLSELDRFIDAMIAIREEIRQIEAGTWPQDNNPLKHAPHTAESLLTEEWTRPYARETAAYPVAALRSGKYWSPVGRVDNVWGDRNLSCSCIPVSDYA